MVNFNPWATNSPIRRAKLCQSLPNTKHIQTFLARSLVNNCLVVFEFISSIIPFCMELIHYFSIKDERNKSGILKFDGWSYLIGFHQSHITLTLWTPKKPEGYHYVVFPYNICTLHACIVPKNIAMDQQPFYQDDGAFQQIQPSKIYILLPGQLVNAEELLRSGLTNLAEECILRLIP